MRRDCYPTARATTRAGAPSDPAMLRPKNMISTRRPASAVMLVTCYAISTPWLKSVLCTGKS